MAATNLGRLIAARAADVAPVRRAWTALGDVPGDEARAGALLRQAIVREPMSDTQLASVRARLRRNRAPSARGARFTQLAAGLAVMLAAGVLLAAAGRFLGWSVLEPARRAVPATVEPQAVHRRAHARARSEVAAPPVAVVPPAEAPLPAVSEPVRPGPAAPPHAPRPARIRRHRARRRSRVPRSPAVASGGARGDRGSAGAGPGGGLRRATAAVVGNRRLAEESGLLTLALRKLRQGRRSRRRAGHARRARAALRSGRRARGGGHPRASRPAPPRRATPCALVRLEGLALAPTGSSRGLLAARAELRAEQGRCAAAVADFDRLLTRAAAHDAIVERALHGRARCGAQVGDVAARAPISERYLMDFPTAIRRRGTARTPRRLEMKVRVCRRTRAGQEDHEAIQGLGRARSAGFLAANCRPGGMLAGGAERSRRDRSGERGNGSAGDGLGGQGAPRFAGHSTQDFPGREPAGSDLVGGDGYSCPAPASCWSVFRCRPAVVRVDPTGVVVGNVMFGTVVPPPAPADLDVGGPTGRMMFPVDSSTQGFAYTIGQELELPPALPDLRLPELDLVLGADTPGAGCRAFLLTGESSTSGGPCWQTDPSTSHSVAVDCGKLALCSLARICVCSSTGCVSTLNTDAIQFSWPSAPAARTGASPGGSATTTSASPSTRIPDPRRKPILTSFNVWVSAADRRHVLRRRAARGR